MDTHTAIPIYPHIYLHIALSYIHIYTHTCIYIQIYTHERVCACEVGNNPIMILCENVVFWRGK